ncbi:Bax inhibitor-1/YccA family protein [Stackebrandtia nassauensis]|uniref:Integral membrane protein n=1 Tax=Stackebrandtia nassauensis (strain DSM 44728 / CIP 108903 / NRRL B-16338 / NBRC 102104 / LLR-40K-21) TaxID=446470 RepID=D3PYF5_STANL|nr:Bax inhibitor-1/YccA family protein [Stackebrandtia nassauensis]ADD41522.1 protein of unknown function DUF1112 [Stackebrandtia nassauensis DSM 44728]
MRSSNGALNRWIESGAGREEMAPEYGHYGQQVTPPQVRPMTLDDVVVRTVGLLLLTGITGTITWMLIGVNPGAAYVLMTVGLLVSLGAMLATMFGGYRLFANPWVPSIYAGGVGFALGGVSAAMEASYPGIVVQAVAATFGVFFGMALLFKAKVVRNSPKFTKFIIGAGFGIAAIILVNLLLSVFGVDSGLFYNGTGEVSWLQWAVAIVFVVWGALSFILDFDMVEQGVRYGAPKKMAWMAAFGMVAGLVFLYLSILRLLSYLRQ